MKVNESSACFSHMHVCILYSIYVFLVLCALYGEAFVMIVVSSGSPVLRQLSLQSIYRRAIISVYVLVTPKVHSFSIFYPVCPSYANCPTKLSPE